MQKSAWTHQDISNMWIPFVHVHTGQSLPLPLPSPKPLNKTPIKVMAVMWPGVTSGWSASGRASACSSCIRPGRVRSFRQSRFIHLFTSACIDSTGPALGVSSHQAWNLSATTHSIDVSAMAFERERALSMCRFVQSMQAI